MLSARAVSRICEIAPHSQGCDVGCLSERTPANPHPKRASQCRCVLQNHRQLLGIIYILFILCRANVASAQRSNVAERLGYPADAKLLIIHADDLAMAHSVDIASFTALDQHAVSSASIMVPCPWLTEVAAYAKIHPDVDLGLHLTLTSEWKSYRWGPVAPRDIVRRLLDSSGYFGREGLWPRATPDDIEREVRAQIEHAIEMGLHPTHLDSHMGILFSTPSAFGVIARLGHEYKLPFLAVKVDDTRRDMLKILSEKDVVLDRFIMADGSIPAVSRTQFYVNTIRNLRPGLTELVVHLGRDDAELEAITEDHAGYSAAWRQRDFDAITSQEFKKALAENHVVVVSWNDIRRLM